MSVLGTMLRRPAVRGQYAGAQHNRLTLDWYASLLSADRELRGALRTLRARSRDLCRNTPHGASLVNLFTTNVVGDTGIRLQNRVTTGTGSLRRSTNDAIEAGWQAWGEAGVCTVDGRLSIEEAEALYIATMITDGEVLIRHREAYDNPFGYALQFLDADQLDEMYDRAPGPDGNEIRMGVEINADGRAVAYHLFDGHPSDLSTRTRTRIRVPASEIIHDFLVFRPGQTRGVPLLTPTMFRFKMLDAYIENEIIASRAVAAKPVYLEVMPEFADVYSDIERPTEPLQMEFEPGTSTMLPPGLHANQMNPTHPTTAHEAFVKAAMRDIAVGALVSYSGLTGDLRDVNYSSIRDGTIRERDVWRGFQRRTVRHFCTPVARRWLKWAATTGAVKLPTLDVARWFAPAWQPRGWTWVDPLNDAQTNQLKLQMGATTRTKIAAELGEDWEDNMRQLAEEQRLADELGVTLLTLDKVTPRGLPKPNEPQTTDGGTPDAGNGNGDGSGADSQQAEALRTIAQSSRITASAVQWIAGREQPPPVINVDARTTVEPSEINLALTLPKAGPRKTELLRDAEHRLVATVSSEVEE